jgi:hypothetical protein
LRGGAGGRDGASQGIALLRLKLLRCGGVFKLQKNNNWAAGLPQMRRYLTCSEPAGYGAQAGRARKYLFMFGNRRDQTCAAGGIRSTELTRNRDKCPYCRTRRSRG